MNALPLVLGVASLVLALYSLASAFRYGRYARKSVAPADGSERGSFLPSVTLVVPCCGEEDGLEENLEALTRQNYPGLIVRFVVESRGDGAFGAISRVLERSPAKGDFVVAGPARGRSQKVHNLLAALEDAPESDVLVFADSDGRPESGWLSRLVAPLARPDVGVASTYRFYLPVPATLSTLLRSVWNASVLTLLGDHDHNFAWGGSMAIRREVFERARVAEAWRNALSDDYALTHAIRRAGLRVVFVPRCLVGSRGSVRLGELLSWTARQIAITRIYWPALFRTAAVSHIVYGAFLVLGPLAGHFRLWSAVLVLGFLAGAVRARAIAELSPQWRPEIERHLWAYALLVPFAGFITLGGVLRALVSRRIEWRGKLYEMRSPTETVILKERTD